MCQKKVHKILSGFGESKQTKIIFQKFIYNINDNERIEFKDVDMAEKLEEIEDMLISWKEHKSHNIAIKRKTYRAKTG